MFFSSEGEYIPSQQASDGHTHIGSAQGIFSPELHWQIIEQSCDCIQLLDLDGHLLYMNRGGQQSMEIDNFSTFQLADWLLFWSGEALQHAQDALILARMGKEGTFEGESLTARGTLKWWDVTVRPVLNTEGQVSHILVTERDSTEHKRIQLACAEQTRLGKLNLAVSVALNQHADMQQMLTGCTQALIEHLDAASARIWVLDETQKILELQASSGLSTNLDEDRGRIPLGSFEIGRIALSRERHLTNHVQGDEQIPAQEWARRAGMVSFAGYPLLLEEKVVGVMALFARKPLSSATLAAMASIANAIASGIERKRVDEERIRYLFAVQEAAAQAQHERTRLTAILENHTDAFMIFDDQWRYTYINPPARAYTGKSWQSLLGKSVWEEFPALVGSLYEEQYRLAVSTQQPVSFELFSDVLDAWFEIHAYPIPGGLVVYFRNISESKQAEAERTQLWEEAKEARSLAEVALQARNDFLSSVSHDLKTPLTVIRGTAQIIQRRLRQAVQADPSWTLERLKVIEASTGKMYGMIEDVLTLAQLKAGQQLELDLRPLFLFTLIKRVVSEQQETTNRHRLYLSTVSENLQVRGDPLRLDRVVTNLLANAIKYSPDGGSITLDITSEEEHDQQWIAIRIQDEGVGIPEADLPSIFDPFYRATNVRGQIPGTGVGLASAAQVVREHGGTISITSQEGQGSSVLVRLPAIVEQGNPSPERETEENKHI